VIHKRTIETSGPSKYKTDKIRSSRIELMICLLQMVHQWLIHSNKIKLLMNLRYQHLSRTMWSKIIKIPVKSQEDFLLLELVIFHRDDPKLKKLEGLSKWTLIRLDHFTSLESICHQDHMLTQSRMATELQVNLIGIMLLRSKPVKVS